MRTRDPFRGKGVPEFEYISIYFYFTTYRKRELQNENLGLNTNITDAMLLSSFKLLHICFPSEASLYM